MDFKEAIDERRRYIDFAIRSIEENLKFLKKINNMPDDLLKNELRKYTIYESVYEDRMKEAKSDGN